MPFEVIKAPPSGVLAGTDNWNVGLITRPPKQPLLRAEFSDFGYTVKDIESHSIIKTVATGSSADIAGEFLFFDTLQTDDFLGKNALGYNYRHQVISTDWTGTEELVAGRDYLFTYTFQTASYGILKQQFLWTMKPGS